MFCTRRSGAWILAAASGLCGCDEEPAGPPPPPQAAASEGTANVSEEDEEDVGSVPDTVSLSAGFRPDPQVLEGVTEGARPANELDSSCSGWVGHEPDHRLETASAFTQLRLLASGGDHDTTLAIRKDDGTVLCSDDAEDHHPVISAGFGAGVHDLWVGVAREGSQVPYELGITERRSVTARGLGSDEMEAEEIANNNGVVQLAPGFRPDPHVEKGRTRGSRRARKESPACRGWIAPRPDHVFVATQGFERLRFRARSEQNTTLVVRRPDGSYLCNDNAKGRDPALTGRFAKGVYRIWIGQHERGRTSRYQLAFTTPSPRHARQSH